MTPMDPRELFGHRPGRPELDRARLMIVRSWPEVRLEAWHGKLRAFTGGARRPPRFVTGGIVVRDGIARFRVEDVE